MRLRGLPIAASLLLAPALAEAHPHVWADAASEVLFDAQGQIVAIRHHWRFDEGFSTYALQGLDLDRDGEYSPRSSSRWRRRMSNRSASSTISPSCRRAIIWQASPHRRNMG